MLKLFRSVIWIFILFIEVSAYCQQKTGLEGHFLSMSAGSGNPDIPSSEASYTFTCEYYIELLDQQTPIDLEYNEDVKKYIDLFLTHRRKDLELSLQRAQLYFPIIEEQLDNYNIPLELKYIAVIESGLNPFAKSPSGAIGLWQFLYNTCSLFDLKVNSYIDERRDPYKSTEAACKYLLYLYSTFNDWNLVMASYNGGPRDVRNAIARSGGKTNYWELRPFLSEQSRNYIPAFIAMNYLMNYYSFHGIIKEQPEYSYANTDTLQINYSVSFEQISAIINIPIKDLEILNPIYRKGIIPESIEPSILILPADKISEYLQHESQILGFTIPVDNYNTLLAQAGSTDNRTNLTHVVKSGEYFHKIALKYNCTIENIKAWNSLSDEPLYPGQLLTIWIENQPGE